MRTNSAKQLFVLNDLLISDPIEVSAADIGLSEPV